MLIHTVSHPFSCLHQSVEVCSGSVSKNFVICRAMLVVFSLLINEICTLYNLAQK